MIKMLIFSAPMKNNLFFPRLRTVLFCIPYSLFYNIFFYFETDETVGLGLEVLCKCSLTGMKCKYMPAYAIGYIPMQEWQNIVGLGQGGRWVYWTL